jgi:uncharacterized protein (TIGR01777 family)
VGNNKVLITGGTGLIGTALAKQLTIAGYEVIILTRDPLKAKKGHEGHDRISFAHWDVKAQTIDTSAVASCNAIVHLAGAGVVDKPWTNAYKEEIVGSRVHSSALIVKALKEMPNKVETVVSASAIGWYGADKDNNHPFVESDPVAANFLGDTCQQWEDSIKPVITLGKRLVICRFGIVLAPHGGALQEFRKPLMVRVAGVIGNGRQIVSWIHIHDLVRIIQYAIEHKEIQGIYNAVAPSPATNEKLTITLAEVMHGNGYIKMHVPAFALKMVMGERSIEVLKSATVSSAKIQHAGFEFQFPEIKQAIKNLVDSK